MSLAALLREIDESRSSVTVAELAARLETTPARVREMLAALRAAGRLGPDGGVEAGTDACATAGSCGVSCPGPADCPFTVDFGNTLEIRRRPR